MLQLVDSVTNEVAFSLRQHLGEEFRVRELRSQTDDEEAWLLVREAEMERRRAIDAAALGGESRDRAIAHLEQSDSLLALAATRDPDWAEPHLQAGWNHLERALAEGEEARVFDPEDATLLAKRPSRRQREALRQGQRQRRGAGPAGHCPPRSLANLELDPDERARLDGEAELWLERAIAAEPGQTKALRELASHARFHQGGFRACTRVAESRVRGRPLAGGMRTFSSRPSQSCPRTSEIT